MKNKLSDLNNYLFEQIELLNDDELTGEKLEAQLKKSEKITKIAQVIIKNNETQFKAAVKAQEAGLINNVTMAKLLTSGLNNEKIQQRNS